MSRRKGTARAASRRCQRAGRGPRLAALVVVMLVGPVPTGAAVADTKSRAIDIMNQSYGDFLNTKGTGEAPFDWSSDGCSWTPPPWSWEQNGPCQLHDFGYRNFGKGLTLERTEDRRAWIDQRFLDEMQRNCNQHWWYTSCPSGIHVMWGVVRNFNDWRD
jgi:Prokaryotic phospholipase A2